MRSLHLILSIIFLSTCFVSSNLQAKGKSASSKKHNSGEMDLKDMFSKGKPAWELTPEEFEKKFRKFFVWLEKDKKEGARYYAVSNPKKLYLSGLRVWEAVARFKDGKFQHIEVSLYNRGDASISVIVTKNEDSDKVSVKQTKLTPTEFKELLKDLNTKINDWLQTKGKALPPKKLVGGSKDIIYEKYWVNGDQCVGLQWSITKAGSSFTPQYIKFTYSKFDPHNDPRMLSTRNKNKGRLKHARKIKDNVTKKDGYVYIDNVPMVDQGPKGYCAVAATERILRYYGSQVDQHELAQLVSSSIAGTDPHKMMVMLKKAAPQLGVKVYFYMKPPDFSNGYDSRDVRDIIKEIDYFNKYLKAKKVHTRMPYRFPLITATNDTTKQLYKDFECKKHCSNFKKFKANIKRNIDQGIPIAWALVLGYVPENGTTPQTEGGHMRLIIGYKQDMSELVFSDSWGAGHEFKTIKTDDAWIVTTFYAAFKPKR